MKKTIYCILFLIIIQSFVPGTLFAGYYDAGKTYYIYRKYDKARDMFKKAIKAWPKHGNAYYFLGEIEKIEKNYDKAQEYFQECVKNPTKRKYLKNAFENLIVLANMKNDTAAIVKTCKWWWIRLRDYKAKRRMETLINKYLWTKNKEAIKLYKQGLKKKRYNKDKALDLLKEAVRTDSDFLAPKFELGMHAYKNNDYSTALDYLDQIASRIVFYAEVHLVVGDIYYKRDSYSTAIDHFNKAFEYGLLSAKTKYYTRLKRAKCYYKTDSYDDAVKDLKDVTSYNPRAYQPLVLLSAIRIKQNKTDSALKSLRRAYRLKPNSMIILYQMGSIYYKKKNWRYVSYFDRLYDIAQKKKRFSDKYYKAFGVLAEAHYKKRSYSRSYKITSSLPDNFQTFKVKLVKAKALFRLGRFDKSIDVFEQLSLNDDDDKYMLAKAYALSKRTQKSKDLFLQIITNEVILKRAKRDKTMGRIVRLIERDRKKQEEDKKPHDNNNQGT